MKKILMLVLCVVLLATPAFAVEQKDVMKLAKSIVKNGILKAEYGMMYTQIITVESPTVEVRSYAGVWFIPTAEGKLVPYKLTIHEERWQLDGDTYTVDMILFEDVYFDGLVDSAGKVRMVRKVDGMVVSHENSLITEAEREALWVKLFLRFFVAITDTTT